jgi:bla regulator protein BlaR1
MTALAAWAAPTLWASTVLMLVALAVRGSLRRWAGPRVAYAVWLLPVARMVTTMLPVRLVDGLPVSANATMKAMFIGPRAVLGLAAAPDATLLGTVIVAVWLIGAVTLFVIYAVRHALFCARLRGEGVDAGDVGGVRVIAVDVDGPLAFGVFRRCIAIPRGFAHDFTPAERALALAHERAHHRHGDLIANWVSLAVLAAHWWNPVAWVAIRAFRADQEFAADAAVRDTAPNAVALYAQVLAKAAGVGALPACNLNPRATLKGRLMMLAVVPVSARRRALGAVVVALFGATALAATIATPAQSSATATQAVTIGVKPDGAGAYAYVIGKTVVAPGAALPGGMTLPGDLDPAGGCDLKASAQPHAMVIKGSGATQTYTVMCASAAPAPVRATLAEGLASLKTMRASIAAQPASAAFPEAERTHALGAVDASISAVAKTLTTIK